MNDTLTGQYLTFNLGDELFALSIVSVREIIDDKNFTKIPNTPDYMRGVINLRGQPVPIVDLRLKFGMSRTTMDVNTCAIITDVEVEGEMIKIGALADSVQEVIELQDEDISPPPKMAGIESIDFILGMAKSDDRFLMIIDMERFLADVQIPPSELLQGLRTMEEDAGQEQATG